MISELRLHEIDLRPVRPSLRPATVVMGLATVVSGGIHAYVVESHLQQWWAAGVFFGVAASVQIACSYVLLRTAGRRGAIPAAITSAVLASVWLASRTIGLPFGPGSGAREVIGAADLLATVTEIAVLVMFVVGLRRACSSERTSAVTSRFTAAGIVALGLTVGLSTAVALPSHGHVRRPSATETGAHSHLNGDEHMHEVDARTDSFR